MKSPTQRKIAALKPLEKRYSVALGASMTARMEVRHQFLCQPLTL